MYKIHFHLGRHALMVALAIVAVVWAVALSNGLPDILRVPSVVVVTVFCLLYSNRRSSASDKSSVELTVPAVLIAWAPLQLTGTLQWSSGIFYGALVGTIISFAFCLADEFVIPKDGPKSYSGCAGVIACALAAFIAWKLGYISSASAWSGVVSFFAFLYSQTTETGGIVTSKVRFHSDMFDI